MLQNPHLAKSIADAPWGTFLEILEDKAARAGHQVIKVPVRFTTQKCFTCGALVPKRLSVRTHICPECGYVKDRDTHAAKNIVQAGLDKLQAGAPPRASVRDTGPDDTLKPRALALGSCHSFVHVEFERQSLQNMLLGLYKPEHHDCSLWSLKDNIADLAQAQTYSLVLILQDIG